MKIPRISAVLESLNSARQKYGREEADRLSPLDPTPTKKYLEFICRVVAEGADESEVSDYVKTFDSLIGKRLIGRDINSFRTFEEMRQEVDSRKNEITSSETKQKAKSTGTEKVYEDSDMLVLRILTKEASCLYGGGTRWCISAKNDNRFDEYTLESEIRFFFVFLKKTHEKYAVSRFPNGQLEIHDAEDELIDSIPGFDIGDIVLKYRSDDDPDFTTADGILKHLQKRGLKYSKNEHGEIDVEGGLRFPSHSLTRIMVRFGKVTGNFDCSDNQLQSLEGAPQTVGGDFDCSNNQISSLKGAPQTVGGDFDCSDNQISSLKGAPQTVGGSFKCGSSILQSLEGAPQTVSGDFFCSHSPLQTLEGAPQKVGGDFWCINCQLHSLKGAPQVVGETFSCSNNQLQTLEGAPRIVGYSFYCYNNRLRTLKGAPDSVGGPFFCHTNPDLSEEEIEAYKNSGACVAYKREEKDSRFSGKSSRIDEKFNVLDLKKGADEKNKNRSKNIVSKLISLSRDGVLTFKSSSETLGRPEYWVQHIQLLDWDDVLNLKGLNYFDRANLVVFGNLKLECTCLAGDTRVPLLDGRELSMLELLEEFGTDKPFWVYSTDEQGDCIPAKAFCRGVSGYTEDLVEIVLDNNTSLRCTPDHLIRLRDGSYRKAQDLENGDSLMPLYRSVNKHGYEEIKNNSKDGNQQTHRIVAEKLQRLVYESISHKSRSQRTCAVVHHQNFNKADNSPGNLVWMTWRDHERLHARLSSGWKRVHEAMKREWADPEKRKKWSELKSRGGKACKEKHPELFQAWRDAGAAWTREHREFHSEKMKNTWADPEKRKSITESIRERSQSPEGRKFLSDVQREAWRDPDKKAQRIADMKAREQTPEFRDRQREKQEKIWQDDGLRERHSMIMKEIANRDDVKEKRQKKTKQMWEDPEQSERWKASMKKAASNPEVQEKKRQKMKEYWRKRKETEANNHKVVSVRTIREEIPVPVYDLTVDGTSNFLISNGIVVHNCPWFLYGGYRYIHTQLDTVYGSKEHRKPKVKNPREEGVGCKHLLNVLNILPMSVTRVASLMKILVEKGEIKVNDSKPGTEKKLPQENTEQDDRVKKEEPLGRTGEKPVPAPPAPAPKPEVQEQPVGRMKELPVEKSAEPLARKAEPAKPVPPKPEPVKPAPPEPVKPEPPKPEPEGHFPAGKQVSTHFSK